MQNAELFEFDGLFTRLCDVPSHVCIEWAYLVKTLEFQGRRGSASHYLIKEEKSPSFLSFLYIIVWVEMFQELRVS